MKIKLKDHDYLLENLDGHVQGSRAKPSDFFSKLRLKFFSFKYCANCDKENRGGLGTFRVGQRG